MLVVMAPIIAWNTPRGWPSVVMQSMRDGLEVSGTDSLLSYLGLAIMMASPPLFVLGLIGFVRGPERPLLILGALPIALSLALFAFTDEVTVNSVVPLAYWWTIPAAMTMTDPRWWSRGLAAIGIALGVVLVPAVYVRAENGAGYILADRYFYPGYLKLTLGTSAPVFHLASPEYDTEYSRWRRWDGFPSARPEMVDLPAIFIGSEQAARLYYATVAPLAPAVRPDGSTKPPELSLYLVAGPRPETMPLFNGWQAP
jgi:hypothetical protein